MKILGISLTTILLVVAVIFVTRKWGNSIPVIKSIG